MQCTGYLKFFWESSWASAFPYPCHTKFIPRCVDILNDRRVCHAWIGFWVARFEWERWVSMLGFPQTRLQSATKQYISHAYCCYSDKHASPWITDMCRRRPTSLGCRCSTQNCMARPLFILFIFTQHEQTLWYWVVILVVDAFFFCLAVRLAWIHRRPNGGVPLMRTLARDSVCYFLMWVSVYSFGAGAHEFYDL